MIRKAVFENLKNLVWALIFAIALWLVMVQSEQTSQGVDATFHVLAPGREINVKYLTPENRPPTFSVTLRGTQQALGRLESAVVAEYDIPPGNIEPGPRAYPTRNFEFRGLPIGVTVDRSSLTQEIQVELARRKTEQLRVDLQYDYSGLPDKWEVAAGSVDPPTLNASGSVEDMERDPEIRTELIMLGSVLRRMRFDEKTLVERDVSQPVAVSAPGGITILDTRQVVARFRLRPKKTERELDLAPKLLFPGPVFPGVPFKLTPFPEGTSRVRVKVSGPDALLSDQALETTKARFHVFVEIPADVLAKAKLGDRFGPIEVKVIAPEEIKLLTAPDPPSFRFIFEPAAPPSEESRPK